MDNRTFHSNNRGVYWRAAGKRNQARRRCPSLTRLEALSAFNKEELARSLREDGIGYEHFPELGGRRKARKDSRNTAWRNESFRGYADHMETAEFANGIARLQQMADRDGATAIMCAEAVWWKCHRSLIADYLKAHGAAVIHIIDASKAEPNPFTSAARIVDGKPSYSRNQQEFLQALTISSSLS